MHQGTVQLVPQKCTTCGAGPWHPRTDRQTDRFTGDIIVEATWVCMRCGSKFAAGVVEVIKKPADEKE